jgi:hypothetical protein
MGFGLKHLIKLIIPPRPRPVSFKNYRLMDFDDVVLWVMEEYLMPLLGKGSPIV